MRRNGKGLVGRMAFESEIEQPGVAEDAAIVGADTESTALLELAEPEAELEADVSDTEEAGEAAASLESYLDFVRDTLSTGGMSKEAAHAVKIGMSHLSRTTGTSAKFPALESFGGATSRIKTTQYAAEEIMDKLKEIWQAIVDALKKAAQWVVDNFNKYFGAAEKLQKRAEAISEKAKGSLGTKKESTIKSAALFKSLHVNNSVSGLPAQMGEVADLVKTVYKNVTDNDIKFADSIVKALESEKADVSGISVAGIGSDNSGGVYGTAPDGMVYQRGDELPGGMALVALGANATKSGVEGLETFGRSDTIMRPYNPKATAKGDSLPTLSSSDIGGIANSVEAVAGAIISGRKIEKDLVEALKKVGAAAEKHSKNVESGDDADVKKSARALQRAVGNITKRLVGTPASITSYASRTASAALNYCEKSLGAYKKD